VPGSCQVMTWQTRSGGHRCGSRVAGPLGQLPELAADLLELQDALIEVGGVGLEQVGAMAAGCLAIVAEDVGIGSVA
jgi:hypothetical protein